QGWPSGVSAHSPATASSAAALLAPRGPERDFFGPKGAPTVGFPPSLSPLENWRRRYKVCDASLAIEVPRCGQGARGRKPQRQPGLHVEAPQQMTSPDLAASCRGTRRRWKALLSFIDWPGRTLWKPKGPKDNYCQPFSHSNLGNLIYTTSGEIPVSSTKNVSFHAHNKPVEAKQKDLKLTHLQS
ncbi:hypothetical protein JEQ12_018347, partial [Ovis aries]